jgi:hypothetical protein
MTMLTRDIATWEEFRAILLRFSRLDRLTREQWWFRGQPDAKHALLATVDRGRSFKSDGERQDFIREIIEEFKREVIYLGGADRVPDGPALELLARHHGLPSPLLDWTRSPYVAACFAFMDHSNATHVSVYACRISQIDEAHLTEMSSAIELVQKPEHLKFNRRAVQQRAVFMRIARFGRTVEDLLGDSLTQFRLPMSERDVALNDLDQMLVNPTTLFYDLDGVARTVASRYTKGTQ